MRKKRENVSIQNPFYIITAGLYALAVYTDWEMVLNDSYSLVGLDFHKTFGGRLKFLTFIDMVNFKILIFIIVFYFTFYLCTLSLVVVNIRVLRLI